MEDERVRLGQVGVDSGQLLVIDPCYLVAFRSGFGDGVYPVWARVRDFGSWGRRVVRVEMDLLGDEEDL